MPTPSRFFAAWGPRRRRVPTQLLRRPDKRESVRDARRAALDHEQDLVVMCDMWVQALAALLRAPAMWDDGDR